MWLDPTVAALKPASLDGLRAATVQTIGELGEVASAHRVGAQRFRCWAFIPASAAPLTASAIADWLMRSPATTRALRPFKAVWAASRSVIGTGLFARIGDRMLRSKVIEAGLCRKCSWWLPEPGSWGRSK